MLTPPGPISSPTMMSTMPARTPPRMSVTIPAITSMTAMIHSSVAAPPVSATSESMDASPFRSGVFDLLRSRLSQPFVRRRFRPVGGPLVPGDAEQLLEQGPVVDHRLTKVLGLG